MGAGGWKRVNCPSVWIMSSVSGAAPASAPGALLLCRAEPAAVRPAAHLLRERMLLAPAGDGWSVLVPATKPWRDGADPVDQVLAGWAAALAVGASWPVVALWWDEGRAGYTLASGFRRTVGYVWLADGTAAGEDEAMRTFAARLGLDPVLDLEELDRLTRPDPAADARARLLGLTAVLARAGVALPVGLSPGEPADRLRAVAAATGGELDVVEGGWLRPWLAGPRSRLLGAGQLAVGLPLVGWGLARRSGGWVAAGAILLAHGARGLAYDRVCGRV